MGVESPFWEICLAPKLGIETQRWWWHWMWW